MKPADHQILRDAVARNSGAVLSLPSEGMFRHHKTRLIGGEESGFWIERPPGDRELVEQLMAGNQPVGITLKTNIHKIVFTTVILQYRGGFRINTDLAVDALLLVWPSDLKAVQRRADYRVTIPLDADLTVRAWRIPEHHILRDRPSSSTELDVKVRNISAGGVALVYTPGKGAPPLTADQRLRIAINYTGGELLLEGRVKHNRDLDGGQHRLGVQFKKLEHDIEGRQTLTELTHIVGQLQRDEIRRHRFARPKSILG
jgi:c-di-GMP-binding flagellar brake protein YcgR